MRESSGSPWAPVRSYQKQKGKMEVEGVQRCKASSRVGRKDRLGSGEGESGRRAETRKREKVAKDPVGRNDPLRQSGREEVGEW